MKATLNAPSAKMPRKELGKRQATKNASDNSPSPRTAAMMISRTNPAMRDSSVYPPTEARRLSIGTGFDSLSELKRRRRPAHRRPISRQKEHPASAQAPGDAVRNKRRRQPMPWRR